MVMQIEKKYQASTPQDGEIHAVAERETRQEMPEADNDWLRMARSAFDSSASYIDLNCRKHWDDGLKAFNNEHASDSKYNSPAYEKRSRLYRPKVRSIIRKNEAAAASAFFSNMDTTSITPVDPNNKIEVASADVMKCLLEYRLTKSIPWFHIVMGGLQDGQSTGAVCGHAYWDTSGADKPCVDLIPVENLRVDPATDWIDPINSSPFVIHLIPMYVMDVKEKMRAGEWKSYPEGVIRSASETGNVSTRAARAKNRTDQYEASTDFVDYETVWVQRHIHRRDGQDWEFYTLSDQVMLDEPHPLKSTVFTGVRPFIIGCVILESHKLYPASVGSLGKGLQDEANEISNQRIDNVKFVLNKKWFYKRGKDVDIGGLIRNVPGGAVAMDDPANDVREISWPDVTQSAYEEQSRIDNDMNDLLGNFSPAQVMADHGVQGPAHNMAMLGQSSGTLVEYLLRTYVVTFVQPILRQLMLLEQEYETDQTILAIAAKKAQLFQRTGLNDVTDELLRGELTLNVNVGMGATDPTMKLQKLTGAISAYGNIVKMGVPGLNTEEIGKEIFGCLGYSDGTRFLTSDNPQVLQLQQQLQQMQKMMQELELKVKDKEMGHQVKLQTTQMTNENRKEIVDKQLETQKSLAVVTHLRAINDAERMRQHDLLMKGIDHAHAHTTNQLDHSQEQTMRGFDHAHATNENNLDHTQALEIQKNAPKPTAQPKSKKVSK